MPKARVFCAGCAVVDDVFRLPRLPEGDGKSFAESRVRCLGGMAAAAAAAAAALGGRAALWAPAGADADGEFVESEIRRLGVEPMLLRRRGSATSFSSVCVDAEGRRMIVNYAPPSLFAPPARLPRLRNFDAALVDVRWPGGALATLRAAAAAGIPAVLDWDTAPALSRADARDLLRSATHVVFSRPGLSGLTRKPGAFRVAQRLKEVADRTGARVAMTNGDQGVVFLREDGRAGSVPAPSVAADNTLGAGDAFHGALALALAEGRKFEDGLAFAAAAAAAKCALPPGRYPRRRAALRLLRDMTDARKES